ncbi:MAG: sulfurtransferase TusA family protein [Chloroflexi bacterium]|nr:sulfurtransferase TusA family protein [Chloroflexota bacterium]
MSLQTKIDKTLDATKTFCPMPVILAREAIDSLEGGQVLELLTTDPGSVADIPAFAKNTGHELLEMKEEGKTYKFYIRKKA